MSTLCQDRNGKGTLLPEGRTTLVPCELHCYKTGIMDLSETRLAKEHTLCEQDSGYTFFWKGKTENKERIHGNGFAIKTTLIKKLPYHPVGINERLMKLQVPLNSQYYIPIISIYAVILTNSDKSKEQLYFDLHFILGSTPPRDKLIHLSDFNARVGRQYTDWKGLAGLHWIIKMNITYLLLLRKCAEHNLVITNMLFRQAKKYNTSWIHLKSR